VDSRGTSSTPLISSGTGGGKRRAAVPQRATRSGDTGEMPVVYPGRRRADRPTDTTTSIPVVREPLAPEPAPEPEPAPVLEAAPTRPTGGRRAARATAPARRPRLVLPEFPVPADEPVPAPVVRRRGFTMPGAPSIVGAAALALAAAGAITVSSNGFGAQLASGEFHKFSSQASVLNGASSIGSSDALSGRKRAVSRDSQRAADQNSKEAKLLAAAEAQAKQRNAALAALAASAQQRATFIAKNAWQLPIPLGVYHLTSRFGECSALWSHCHTGLDFAASAGTPIHAVAGGTVTLTGWGGAYGNRTEITLDDGTQLWYCHQTSIGVSMGQHVDAGQFIGTVGSTGNVTGPHLHLEVRPGGGDPVDPYAALVAHGVNPD